MTTITTCKMALVISDDRFGPWRYDGRSMYINHGEANHLRVQDLEMEEGKRKR